MENTKCGVGDRENPRHSLSPGDGKDRGTAVWCRAGQRESRQSLSPWDSGDGKGRGTAVWHRAGQRNLSPGTQGMEKAEGLQCGVTGSVTPSVIGLRGWKTQSVV